MTNAVLRIAPRGDGSHVRVAILIVNNNRKQWSGAEDRLAQPQVGSSHDAAVHRVRDARYRPPDSSLSHDVKQPTFTRSRGAFAPGLCFYLRPTEPRGWAERRQAHLILFAAPVRRE